MAYSGRTDNARRTASGVARFVPVTVAPNGWASRSLFGGTFSCMAVCDVIYRPEQFVSTTPHWVVDQVDYVVTRHLCVWTLESMKLERTAPPASSGSFSRALQLGAASTAASLASATASAAAAKLGSGMTGLMTGGSMDVDAASLNSPTLAFHTTQTAASTAAGVPARVLRQAFLQKVDPAGGATASTCTTLVT
jgi:hypothetical protein